MLTSAQSDDALWRKVGDFKEPATRAPEKRCSCTEEEKRRVGRVDEARYACRSEKLKLLSDPVAVGAPREGLVEDESEEPRTSSDERQELGPKT